jgi:serine protease Do
VGLSEPYGVKIASLSDNSAAARAGLEEGDIIIAVDGKKVERVGQLQQDVGFKKPGETVSVEVARKGGTRKTVKVRLQSLDEAQELAGANRPDAAPDGPAQGSSDNTTAQRLGVQVEGLDAEAVRQLGLPAGTTGVVVTDVTPGGPTWEVLRPVGNGFADIIVSVEGQPVRTTSELRNVLQAQKPGSVVTLRILRVLRGASQRRVERVQLAE